MLSSWQHLPETINPIAFTVGFFSVYWYALWFLFGFFTSLLLAWWLAKRGDAPCHPEAVLDMFVVLFFGALLGGRIGYALFYHLDIFLASPASLFFPYDFSQRTWTGLSGMSYHGGLIGVALALVWFVKRESLSFWQAADFVALLAPVAIFFGRLGNFFNVELPGRITTEPWGMVFPGMLPVGALRHPSTLYEAFFEGIVIFIVLLSLRRLVRFDGALVCLYLACYALARFGNEYFREPDPQLGFFFGLFTLGQIFSVTMFALAVVLFVWLKGKNRVTIADIT